MVNPLPDNSLPPITAMTHPLVKETVLLHQSRGRKEAKRFIVEGKHSIEEALRAGLICVHRFYLAEVEADKLPVLLPHTSLPGAIPVSLSVMKKLSTTDSPPPCVAVFEMPENQVSFSKLLNQPSSSFILVLYNIQDPGNLGTLIRSACAFGVDAVVLTGETVDAYNPKVIRGATGLLFRLPLVSVSSLDEALTVLHNAGVSVAIAQADKTSGSVQQQPFPAAVPMALVLGGEGKGIPPAVAENALYTTVSIPMAAGVDSLNVAISGSILMAQAYQASPGKEVPHGG